MTRSHYNIVSALLQPCRLIALFVFYYTTLYSNTTVNLDAGYVDRIRGKYTAKWGVQMTEMNLQTHSRAANG
ncbi:DUF6783 domain-containing protein [Clostridium sp. MCC353]|uniref:DUF6783 domain-containing protein n=1 Tax=Clostridium sp. MCC353 TaxID=2592646 RepID=UPI0031FE8364